jgi:acyl-CoA reductase-like NAD-dependent aldehyde dehydrogenase
MSQVAKILRDGHWTAARSRDTRFIRNPATLELVGTVPECNADDVDAAVEAAAAAQRDWWKTPGVEKAKHLREIASKIRGRERALSTLMARETGKPLIEAVDCIEWVAAAFDYYAEVGRRS